MASEQQQRREEIRREVRAYLAERLGLAFSAASIARSVRNCSEAEATTALALLISMGQAEENPDSLGATLYYRITAAGALAHERGT